MAPEPESGPLVGDGRDDEIQGYVERLGGLEEVAKLLREAGVDVSPGAVYQWKWRRALPSKYHEALIDIARTHGIAPPPPPPPRMSVPDLPLARPVAQPPTPEQRRKMMAGR